MVEESDLNKTSTEGSDKDESSFDEPVQDESSTDGSDLDESSTDESNIVEFYFDEPVERSDSDESSIGDFNLNDLRVEVSDLDQSNDEESDTDKSSIEESHHDLEASFSNIYGFDVHEFTVKKTVSNVLYVRKLNNFVNYIDQCNSDKGFILKMHTKAIQDLTPLTEEPSALELGIFTDKLVLHVWVLQMHDPQNVDQWSGFLIDVIYKKLDPVTKNLWNKFAWHYYNIHCKNVCMNAVLDFLRATCCEYEKKPPRSISCICYVYYNLSSEY